MTLHFYIARRFLRSFVITALILACIFMLMDMLEQVRKYDSTQVALETFCSWSAPICPNGCTASCPPWL